MAKEQRSRKLKIPTCTSKDYDGFIHEEKGSVKMVKGCRSSDQGSTCRIKIVFKIDTDASYNMHNHEDSCKTYLINYNESMHLRNRVAN